MAVETQTRPPAVSAESNGHRRVTRLHEEILPPALAPSTPAARRRARRALVILAIGMILIQFISAPIGHRLNSIARTGTDAYSLWQHYAASPVPDVLFIGASSARTDIDEPELSADLSNAAGRSITVEKLGFAGQTPMFLDVLMYRIMKRHPHPSLIVVALAGPELSAGCVACLASTQGGLWDISDLTDPTFMRLALNVAPNPAGLVTGWVLPVVAYYPSLIALQCVSTNYGRAGAMALLGRLPVQLQNPTICEGAIPYKWARQAAMSATDYQSSVDTYRGFMYNYLVSREIVSSVTDLVTRARSGGTSVLFMETPLHPGLRSSFSGPIETYQQQLHALAANLNGQVVDFSGSVPGDPTLWADGVHLDRAGADYLGPQLARALIPYLSPAH